jgi:hypothetical protein
VLAPLEHWIRRGPADFLADVTSIGVAVNALVAPLSTEAEAGSGVRGVGELLNDRVQGWLLATCPR